MTKISGFTYIHNAIAGGYPLREAIFAIRDRVDDVVVVDCQSTDGTREWLQTLGVMVIDGRWDGRAGETLAAAHALNTKCAGDIIWHFEADEVFDETLAREVALEIEMGNYDLAVWRLQVEQNFQRVRWWPEPVHRIYPKGSVTKQGHTTTRHSDAKVISHKWGFLWDCTNIFRDNWRERYKQQAELWGHSDLTYRRVPLHFMEDPVKFDIEEFLQEPHWTWTETPLAIPKILRPLVGKTRYEP